MNHATLPERLQAVREYLVHALVQLQGAEVETRAMGCDAPPIAASLTLAHAAVHVASTHCRHVADTLHAEGERRMEEREKSIVWPGYWIGEDGP